MGDDNGYRKIEQYNNATIDSMAKNIELFLRSWEKNRNEKD